MIIMVTEEFLIIDSKNFEVLNKYTIANDTVNYILHKTINTWLHLLKIHKSRCYSAKRFEAVNQNWE